MLTRRVVAIRAAEQGGLPLGGRATSINCNGGSIYISSEISNVTLSYKDFAPLLRENQEES